VATIGLRDLFYAKITEDESTGEETYGTPKRLAKAIDAKMSIDTAEASLYSDDGLSLIIKEFTGGKINLTTDELPSEAAADLLGFALDKNKVLVSASDDGSNPVALGFRAKNARNGYTYIWLYKVQFSIPESEYKTKGDKIEFTTPSIEGAIMRRNKPDSRGENPWRVIADSNAVPAAVITDWFKTVYEPEFNQVISNNGCSAKGAYLSNAAYGGVQPLLTITY
jgi:phi13 family phage major tail protein